MQLGKYAVGHLIGTGGMGAVYEGEDTFLKRKVAIKILPDSVAQDSNSIRRFVLEARAFARVNHPNAVQIYEVNKRKGVCYLAMELMRGGSMQDLLKRLGALAWPEATLAVADACRALVATHAVSLVHRDINPGNLMRSADGVVKLADFGLAKDADQRQASLTMPGGVMGTPSYMSPEQCRSEPVDARTDIYALGATYYTLLVGRPPYVGETPLQVLFAHCSAAVPDPRDVAPEVPAACAAIVRRAMAKEPRDRYQSARTMLVDLESVLSAGQASAMREAGHGEGDMLADLAQAVHGSRAGVVAAPAKEAVEPEGAAGAGGEPLPAPAAAFDRHARDADRWRRHLWPWAIVAGVLAIAGAALPAGLRYWGLLANSAPSSSSSSSSPNEAELSVVPAAPSTRHTDASSTRTAPRPATREFAGGALGEGGMLDADEDAVAAISFSRDGDRLAVARGTDGHGGGVKVWETNSGKRVPGFYQGRTIHDVCFSPNKHTLAGAGSSGVVLRDGDGGWEFSPPGGPSNGPAWALAFSSNGKWLAALVGGDVKHRSIRVWDMGNWHEVTRLNADDSQINSLAFSHDGKYVTAGDEDGVKLWSTSNWKPLKELPAGGRVTATAFSPSNGYLAVAVGNLVQFWDARGGWTIKPTHWGLDARVTCLAYTSDGKILACGTADGFLHLWDASTDKSQKRFAAHKAGLVALAFMPDSRVIATGSSDKTVRLFDVVKTPGTRAAAGPPAGTRMTTKPAINSGTERPGTKAAMSTPTILPAHASARASAGSSHDGVR
jgi:WD40 repeat protein